MDHGELPHIYIIIIYTTTIGTLALRGGCISLSFSDIDFWAKIASFREAFSKGSSVAQSPCIIYSI